MQVENEFTNKFQNIIGKFITENKTIFSKEKSTEFTNNIFQKQPLYLYTYTFNKS